MESFRPHWLVLQEGEQQFLGKSLLTTVSIAFQVRALYSALRPSAVGPLNKSQRDAPPLLWSH